MDDLISRRAAIDALGEQPDSGDWMDEWECGCRSQWEWDKEAIENVPSAQPEPQRGNWLMRDGRVICSSCENVPYNKIEYDGVVVYHIPKIAEVMKYCPICGARMS